MSLPCRFAACTTAKTIGTNEAASWARAGMLPWGPYREPDPRKVNCRLSGSLNLSSSSSAMPCGLITMLLPPASNLIVGPVSISSRWRTRSVRFRNLAVRTSTSCSRANMPFSVQAWICA